MLNIKWSASKLLGFLIFISGALYSFIFKDADVLMNGWLYSALLVGTKTAIAGIENVKGVKK